MAISVKNSIKTAVNVLKNPEKEFSSLHTKKLENVIFDYFQLLIVLVVVVATVNLLISFIRALYLDIFLAVEIDYLRFLNFVLSQSSAIAIIYLVSATFLIFFLLIILKIFFRRIKYTELLKRMAYSLSPILLFGWTPKIALALLVWCAFLFFVGVKYHQGDIKIDRRSIEQRE